MIHLRLVNDNLHEAREDYEKLKNHISLTTDNADYYIENFINLKNNNKIIGSEKDIYFWLKKPAEDFIEFIDEKLLINSKSQTKKNIKISGSRFVCDNDNWSIYEIKTHAACRYYGRGTKWCITEKSDYYWRKYLLQGYKFYFCINKKPVDKIFNKLALQCTDRSIYRIWDASDNSYSPHELDYLNIPDISDDIRSSSKSQKIGKGLIQTSQNILTVKKSNLDTKVRIPNSIIAIPNESFAHSSIESITFESDSPLTQLSNGLCYDCNNLVHVKLPDNLQVLSRGSFHSCDKLNNVTLPNSLKVLEPFCFAGCSNLDNISIPRNVEIIQEGVFKSCINLCDISIHSDNIQIDDLAFKDCPKLIIHASEDSDAYKFAVKHNIPFSSRAQA